MAPGNPLYRAWTEGWVEEEEELKMIAYSIDLNAQHAYTLDSIIRDESTIPTSSEEITIYKDQCAFSRGGIRWAFLARIPVSNKPFVVKTPIKGWQTFEDVDEEMRCQFLCKAFTVEFNLLLKEHIFDVAAIMCLEGKAGTASRNQVMSLEPFLEGRYVKYNGNDGSLCKNYPGDMFDEAQAFSHFTYERSQGQMMFVDIQGAGGMLTDTAVHTSDRKRFRRNRTNRHTAGFSDFFDTHICNSRCRDLNLADHRRGLVFWQTLFPIYFCAHRLCRRVLYSQYCTFSNGSGECRRYCLKCWIHINSQS